MATRNNDGSFVYLHSDHLGSVVAETLGTTAHPERYHAYGSTRSSTTLPYQDYKFTGQLSDGTGLVYMNARYYDPAIGQFISPDTIVPNPDNLQDYNRYMYVRGNPLKMKDPSGHVAIPVHDGSGGAQPVYDITRWGEIATQDPSRAQGEMLAWLEEHQNFSQILAMQDFLEERFVSQQIVPAMFFGVFINSASGAQLSGLMEGPDSVAVGDYIGAVLAVVGLTDALPGQPRGGVYLLKDPLTGDVVRVGRTNNLLRREFEHRRGYPELDWEVYARSDDPFAVRGLEQSAYDQHRATLRYNAIQPISPRNPNYQLYIDAAKSVPRNVGP